jgi:hypothetical protein
LSLNSLNSKVDRSSKTAVEHASSIDVDQWRQDVDAFAMATRQMLNSIHEELSNGLSKGHAQVSVVTGVQTNSGSSPSPPPRPISVNRDRESFATRSEQTADECDQLLAKLKKQLSDQLSQ